ncbi:VWA domain-containing protein [Nocardioides sp. LS1]|uniref:VWA domain-containing protein n=1 Tax=Nocardioides sp. LS1 TaxID=1027620 RepID=UPI00163B5BC0|nr:VWA domain-containing protein [Nocardioides sp. LS1]
MATALLALAITGGAREASAAALPQTHSDKGFAEVAGCISSADNLLISIVVDESQSLRTTDPHNLRVQGITSAVDSLEQLAELSRISGRDLRVETSLATFARGYEVLKDWTRLTSSTAASMRELAVQELPGRADGNATDYRQALLGAKRQLEVRAGQLGDSHTCKVVLWFTDGALDVDSATQTAATEICQTGGIADSMRHAGISVIALALFAPGADVSPAQRDQLRAVAEGSGASTTCGTTPISADDTTGVYLPADDPAALQLLFAGAGAFVAGGTAGPSATCPGQICAHGAFPIQVDRGIAGARIVVQTQGNVVLRSPSGREVRLVDGLSASVDGTQVLGLKRGTLTTINLAYDPYAQSVADWTVISSGPSRVETYWFWGAKAVPVTKDLRAGSQSRITYRLVDQAGNALPAELFSDVQASITVGGEKLATRVDPDGSVSAAYRLPTDDLPSSLPGRVEITAMSSPSGIRLGPVVASNKLRVTLPPEFPTVTPDTVDFGSLEGLGTRTANLDLVGSALGATKVCLSGSSMTAPGQQSDSEQVHADKNCVELPRNGRGTMRLSWTPQFSADGIATGTITLALESAEGKHANLSLPASLSMARQVDKAKRWELIAALFLLALLIPTLLLVGSNLLLGRFSMTSGTRVARVPVQITTGGLSRQDGRPLLESSDLKNVGFSGRRRSARLPVDGTGVTLRARRIISLRAPLGVASDPGALKLVSGSGRREVTRKKSDAPVGLGEVDATFVSVMSKDADGGLAAGTLIVVVPASVDLAGAQARALQIASRTDWRRILDELDEPEAPAARPSRAAASTRVSPSPTDPSGTDHSNEPGITGLPGFLSGASKHSPPASDVPSRGSAISRRRKADQPPSQPTGSTESSLPPLPDFLRDKD